MEPAGPASRCGRHSEPAPAQLQTPGCETAAASQPGETHISEVVRLLPHTCTLLSNPPGCEVFQKQKVILLQSRKGRFHQPAGKMSGTTSTTAAENSLAKGQQILQVAKYNAWQLTHQHPSALRTTFPASRGSPQSCLRPGHRPADVAVPWLQGRQVTIRPRDPLRSGERERVWTVAVAKCQAQ